MIILIDYDNLARLKEMKLTEILEKLLEKSPIKSSRSQVSCCRLYGGWLFHGKKVTNLAAKLSAQITKDFPRVIRVLGHKVRFDRPELATSLLCDPGNVFPNTFRIRSYPPSLRVKNFPFRGCIKKDQCPLTDVDSFFRQKICVHDQCNVTPSETFYRTEQKLVDSMIVTDLVHLSTVTKEHIILVSGDDDMWPGIRYALINDVRITHIIPRSIKRRKNPYENLSTQNYFLERV